MDRKEIKKTCGGFVAEERSRHVETIGKLRLSLFLLTELMQFLFIRSRAN
jgi:hypothetical protein